MICLFILQMWELFDQYISNMKTVAVSFKEEIKVEFPIFAFCDSTGFSEQIGIIANETVYNATTFDVEVEATIWEDYRYTKENITSHFFPTTDNGYCRLIELHGKFQANAAISKLKTT